MENKIFVRPAMAIPGGVVELIMDSDSGLVTDDLECRIGGIQARIVSASRRGLHVLVPEGIEGVVKIEVGSRSSDSSSEGVIEIGREFARDLHIVANPAVDPVDGSIVATRSGSRGQQLPVTMFRIRTAGSLEEINADIMNPTGVAFDKYGTLYISARADGEIWRLSREGKLSACSTGLGVPTGIAFDASGILHVGDRTGNIYKISDNGDSEVLAKLDPSVAAYHLAFDGSGNLYVSAPSLSGYDSVEIVDKIGFVRTFFRGLGRPQGMAFDSKGFLFIAASFKGSRGVVKISPEGEAELVLAGSDVVGVAFRGADELIVATREKIFVFGGLS